ncbi:MAG: YunC family protein [Turicibacter sp.]
MINLLNVNKIKIEGYEFITYEVFLPKTTLFVVANEVGYIMCAALDIDFFNNSEKLRARKIIAGRAEGVRSIEQLLDAPLAKVTIASEELGIVPGVIGRDALVLMAKNAHLLEE